MGNNRLFESVSLRTAGSLEDKIERLHEKTARELKYAELEMREEVAQCKRYAETIMTETEPFLVLEAADNIARARRRLATQMQRVKDIQDQMTMINLLRQTNTTAAE